MELVLCETAQLCDEIHQRRCHAPLLLTEHKGSQCLLGHSRLTHHLDALKRVSLPLYGEAWGWCPVTTPIAPCLHPTIQALVLSHEQSISPAMVHPIHLMFADQMNQLLVWALLHLFAHDAPPAVFVAIALPSLIGTNLVLSLVAPSSHSTPYLLLQFSSYLSSFTWCACCDVASFPK